MERLKKELIGVAAIVAQVLVLAALFAPAPFNPQYWIKRAFHLPTALCRDNTYSFAENRRGACSYHGGVARWQE